MNNKYIIAAKYTVFTLILIVLYVLQTTPSLLSVYGIKPNLVVPCAVCIAMLEGEFVGGLFGALAGILCDVGGFMLFGFHGMLIMTCCVIAGLLVIYLIQLKMMNCVVLCFCVLLVEGTLGYLFSYGIWGYENAWKVFVFNVLPGVIYSTALAPVFWGLFVRVKHSFDSKLKT